MTLLLADAAQVFETIGYVLVAILTLMVMIIVHEAGHYTVGKLLKFKINEFAIGMGPKIYSWTGKQGTKYALRAFPIGGFVQMEGEEGTSENPMAYNNLNPWKKIVVTAAGPIVNIVFAIILMFSPPFSLRNFWKKSNPFSDSKFV